MRWMLASVGALLGLQVGPLRICDGVALELDVAVERGAVVGSTPPIFYDSPIDGVVAVYALSDDLDARLVVSTRDGRVLESDDDGGGWPTPYVGVEVARGDGLTLVVETADRDARGKVRVVVNELAETEATRSASRAAFDEIGLARAEIDRGEFEPARARLRDALDALEATEGATRSLEVQTATWELAKLARAIGDGALACRCFEAMCKGYEAVLPPEHELLLTARQNVALGYAMRGELAIARELAIAVLEARARTLHDGAEPLQQIRVNLAGILKDLGELHAARALEERALAAIERLHGDDPARTSIVRGNLAQTRFQLGDLDAARVLQESVLAHAKARFAEDAPDLQFARMNLAATLRELGKVEAARALEEQALAAFERMVPDDHDWVLRGRGNLAITLKRQGRLEEARALEQRVLEGLERTLPRDHPMLQTARDNLASTWRALGERERARELQLLALDSLSRVAPDDHPAAIAARTNLAWTSLELGDLAQAATEAGRLCRAVQARLAADVGRLSPRERQSVATAIEPCVSTVLSVMLAEPRPLLDAAFALVESVRAQGVARAPELATASAQIDALRREVATATAAVSRAAREGTIAKYLDAIERKEAAERRWAERLAADRPSDAEAVDATRAVAASLGEREVAIGFRRFLRRALGDRAGEDRLIAFVVRKGEPPVWLDLAPIDDVAAAAAAWRAALLVARSESPARDIGTRAVEASAGADDGARLRRLVLDPLAPAIGDARRAYVALDDALHTVPLDALPERDGVVGDRLQVVVLPSLLDLARAAARREHAGALVCLGDVDYGEGGDALRRFAPLPATRAEVVGIATLRASVDATSAPAPIRGAAASAQALFELAPTARYLHVATHGYSIESSDELERRVGFDDRFGVGEAPPLRAFSPMLLCGLALAGANAADDELGRRRGIVTAQDLATLDLSRCELAVLSACETGAGVGRAGQGVASLQAALHAAGARTVIASLWRVGDQAAQTLMLEFYRRLWVDRMPVADALWHAKRALRERTDGAGRSLHPTRDWAGWVLSGAAQ